MADFRCEKRCPIPITCFPHYFCCTLKVFPRISQDFPYIMSDDDNQAPVFTTRDSELFVREPYLCPTATASSWPSVGTSPTWQSSLKTLRGALTDLKRLDTSHASLSKLDKLISRYGDERARLLEKAHTAAKALHKVFTHVESVVQSAMSLENDTPDDDWSEKMDATDAMQSIANISSHLQTRQVDDSALKRWTEVGTMVGARMQRTTEEIERLRAFFEYKYRQD